MMFVVWRVKEKRTELCSHHTAVDGPASFHPCSMCVCVCVCVRVLQKTMASAWKLSVGVLNRQNAGKRWKKVISIQRTRSHNMAAARREANGSSCRSRTRRWRQRKKLGFKCRPVIPFVFSLNPFFPTSLVCSLLVYDGIMRKRGEERLIEMRSRSAK